MSTQERLIVSKGWHKSWVKKRVTKDVALGIIWDFLCSIIEQNTQVAGCQDVYMMYYLMDENGNVTHVAFPDSIVEGVCYIMWQKDSDPQCIDVVPVSQIPEEKQGLV